ncbi:hypothetical protein RND71_035576 [Anisodus tanguticus]|uniref:Uncharacterized protein n=1 Tax=Anisodus tanguticus TaxID=243964 RepID=A0AAE1V2B1_9SOLA|nr:hypothetical protein RND71_035576 [Anisodus tanguticus]
MLQREEVKAAMLQRKLELLCRGRKLLEVVVTAVHLTPFTIDENIFRIDFFDEFGKQAGFNIFVVAIYQLFVIEIQRLAHGIDKKKSKQKIKRLEMLFDNKTEGEVDTAKEDFYD